MRVAQYHNRTNIVWAGCGGHNRSVGKSQSAEIIINTLVEITSVIADAFVSSGGVHALSLLYIKPTCVGIRIQVLVVRMHTYER